MRKERRNIPLADILPNTGQAEWLPANPRQWTAQDINRTARSIKEDTDFLEERPILVFPLDDKFIAFAGNLRREGCVKNKMATAPCVIHYPENEADQETIKRRAIKDNGTFGSWDFDALANEWDGPLTDWGVPVWDTEPEVNLQSLDGEDTEVEESEEVEKMINEAVALAAGEVLEQIKSFGGQIQFITPHSAKVDFIKFAYYRKDYPRYNSLAFHPQQIFTPGDTRGGITDALAAVRDGRTKPERLRFVTGDDFTRI